MNIFRTLGLFLFIALAATPLLLAAGYALLYSLGLTGLLNEGFTLVHWAEVVFSIEFWRTIGFSMYVALTAIGISVALALFAVVRWTVFFQKGPLAFLIYLPLALPAIVVAFISFQLLSGAGFFSRLSYQTGLIGSLENFPSLVNDPYGVGIILSHVFMATPFFIILFSNLYRNERLEEYAQVAATLGASARQISARVIAPALLTRSFSTIALYFIFVMGSYEIPLLLSSQSPTMVSVLTIRKLQRYNLYDIPQAYTISVIYTLLVVVLVFYLLNTQRRTES